MFNYICASAKSSVLLQWRHIITLPGPFFHMNWLVPVHLRQILKARLCIITLWYCFVIVYVWLDKYKDGLWKKKCWFSFLTFYSIRAVYDIIFILLIFLNVVNNFLLSHHYQKKDQYACCVMAFWTCVSIWRVNKSEWTHVAAGRGAAVTLSGSGLWGSAAPPRLDQSEKKPASPAARWPLIYSSKAQLMQHWSEITRAPRQSWRAAESGPERKLILLSNGIYLAAL